LARGVDARPLVPWVDEVPFEAAVELEWPIEGLEPLSFVLARLFEPLSDRLEQADRAAAVIHTSLRLTTKRVHSRTLQLPAPMRDAKTLRTLVLLDMETHPPDAPIDTVRIFLEPTPGRVLQWTLLERAQPAPEQVSTLIARLSALMGDSHVGSPQLVDTWRPGAFEMTGFRVLGCPPPRPEAAATAGPRRSSPGVVVRAKAGSGARVSASAAESRSGGTSPKLATGMCASRGGLECCRAVSCSNRSSTLTLSGDNAAASVPGSTTVRPGRPKARRAAAVCVEAMATRGCGTWRGDTA